MDESTLHAYDGEARKFADDWHEQAAPVDMYALLERYFTPGLTADVGCGSGRDAAWLSTHGFEVIGYDASLGLLQEARTRYPELRFAQAVLPELEGMEQGSFQNILCETVIMHLEPSQIGQATRRLIDVLKPGGTLFLSWRVTEGASQRDTHQRLYSSFDKARVLNECVGHSILLNQEDTNVSSGKIVHRVIVRKATA
ncbi:MAG: class I SAM-dependent methyltransferase [Rhodanobacter sp.]